MTVAAIPAPTVNFRSMRVGRVRRLLGVLGIYLMLGVLFIAGAIASPRFATTGNLLNVLRGVTFLGIVAAGTAFVTCSRHYVDLSIPQIMAFAGLAAISAQPWGVVAGLGSGLLAGILVGLVNGYAIGYRRVNPIIWTLAIAFLLDGLLRWGYSGHQVYPDRLTASGAFFLNLSQRTVGGVLPLPTAVMILMVLAGHWVLKHTRFGTQLRLVGSSYEVARLSGVRVRSVVMFAFVASAVCATIAGILLSSMNKQGTFETGAGYDFNSVTAVVLGGVLLSGGRGSVAGAIGGVLIIGVLLNLMTLMGLGSFPQMVVKGIVFTTVVAITSWIDRRSGRGDV